MILLYLLSIAGCPTESEPCTPLKSENHRTSLQIRAAERQDLLHGAGGHRPPADYVVMFVLVDTMVIGLMDCYIE